MRRLRQSPRGSRARRLGSYDPLDLLDVGLHARDVAAHLTERRLGVGHPRLEPGDTVIESARQPVGGLCAALDTRFDTGHALVQSEYFLAHLGELGRDAVLLRPGLPHGPALLDEPDDTDHGDERKARGGEGVAEASQAGITGRLGI